MSGDTDGMNGFFDESVGDDDRGRGTSSRKGDGGREMVSVMEGGMLDVEREELERKKASMLVIPLSEQSGISEKKDDGDEGTETAKNADGHVSLIGEMLKLKRQREKVVAEASAAASGKSKGDRRRAADLDAERFHQDVLWRPADPTLEDYAAMPISGFGEALLRGQGWEPGKPIGLHATEIVEPIVAKPRPGNHLGLGASERSAALQKQLKELRKKGVDVDSGLEALADQKSGSPPPSRRRDDDDDDSGRHSSRHSHHHHHHHHHGHSHSRHRDRSGSRSRSRSRSRSKERVIDKHKRGLLVRVSEEHETHPEFRGLYGVMKDWEGVEEGPQEQGLVRLQNVDTRKELGAREVWFPLTDLELVPDPRKLLNDGDDDRHRHHHHHHQSRVSSSGRLVYDFWYKTTHDRAFMEAPLQADHLREQRILLQKQQEEEELRARIEADVEEAKRQKRAREAAEPVRKRARMERPTDMWAVPGLVVKICGEGVTYGNSNLFGRNAIVVDVVSQTACTLHVLPTADDPRTSVTADNVAITDIETIVPAAGEQVLVLRGTHKGCTGDVIEDSNAQGGEETGEKKVTVQLHDDDMSVQMYNTDDVCLYQGSGP